jgi:hypothetical protein
MTPSPGMKLHSIMNPMVCWALASSLSAAALTASTSPENSSPPTHDTISSLRRSMQLLQSASSFSATAAVESEALTVVEAGTCVSSVEGLAAAAGVSWSGGTSETLDEVEAPGEEEEGGANAAFSASESASHWAASSARASRGGSGVRPLLGVLDVPLGGDEACECRGSRCLVKYLQTPSPWRRYSPAPIFTSERTLNPRLHILSNESQTGPDKRLQLAQRVRRDVLGRRVGGSSRGRQQHR